MIPDNWMTRGAAIGAILSAVGGMLTGVIDVPAGVGTILAAIATWGAARKLERMATSNEEAVKLEKEVAVQAGVSPYVVESLAPKKEKEAN